MSMCGEAGEGGARQIEEADARLRAMMPWIGVNKLVDKDRN